MGLPGRDGGRIVLRRGNEPRGRTQSVNKRVNLRFVEFFVCCCLFFETWYLCRLEPVLELLLFIRLALNSRRSYACLCLQSARIKGVGQSVFNLIILMPQVSSCQGDIGPKNVSALSSRMIVSRKDLPFHSEIT